MKTFTIHLDRNDRSVIIDIFKSDLKELNLDDYEFVARYAIISGETEDGFRFCLEDKTALLLMHTMIVYAKRLQEAESNHSFPLLDLAEQMFTAFTDKTEHDF